MVENVIFMIETYLHSSNEIATGKHISFAIYFFTFFNSFKFKVVKQLSLLEILQ